MVMGGDGQHTDQKCSATHSTADFDENASPFSKLDQAAATCSAGDELAAGDDSR